MTQGQGSDPSDQQQSGSSGPGPIDPNAGMQPPAPPPGFHPGYAAPPPAASEKKSFLPSWLPASAIFSLLAISLLINLYLYLIVTSMAGGLSESTYKAGEGDDRIVIVPVSGMITDEMAVFVRRSLDALAEEDNQPAAIVLRVDSGGGGVSASDRIWHEIKSFKNETGIPVVASFGSVAASGGYYISAPCDYIVAEPTGITGSIGVIAQAFTVQELMEKVGVTPQVIIADGSTDKDVLNPFRSWTDKDITVLKDILNEAHKRFVHVVAEGRSKVLTEEEALAVATGKPFTVSEAIRLKLVDEEGYLDAAIAKAGALAGLDADADPNVTIISQPAGLAGLLGLSAPPASRPQNLSSISGEDIRQWLAELSTPKLEYRFTLPAP